MTNQNCYGVKGGLTSLCDSNAGLLAISKFYPYEYISKGTPSFEWYQGRFFVYFVEQLLLFSRALQTSRVPPYYKLDFRTPKWNELIVNCDVIGQLALPTAPRQYSTRLIRFKTSPRSNAAAINTSYEQG